MSTIKVNALRHTGGSSDNINLDSSGNVGVGASTPSDFNDGGTGGKNLVIEASGVGRGVLTFAAEQTGGADEPLGIVNFVDSDTTNTSKRGARIVGLRGSDANSAYMRFETANSGAPAEVGRFTHDGEFRFNSGYGSVATAYGVRAWITFNGGAATIGTGRASGNMDAVTDNGAGDYTLNFTNDMPDANYCLSANIANTSTSYASIVSSGTRAVGTVVVNGTTAPTTGAIRINSYYGAAAGSNGASTDFEIFAAIIR